MRKRNFIKCSLSILLSACLMAGCTIPVMAEDAASEAEWVYTEEDLPAAPEYGANPELYKWTTVLYEMAGQTLTVTVATSEDESQYEIICSFFGDDQMVEVEYDGSTYTVVADRTGFMGDSAEAVITLANEQNIWLSTESCSAEYVNPIAVDNNGLSPAINAGIWEEDFVRTNDNLNYMIIDPEDETYQTYLTTCEEQGTIVEFEYDTYFYALDAYNEAEEGTTAITKTAYVYLPYGYDETVQYNVLYLLHGGGDTATAWFSKNATEDLGLGNGPARNILDNMIANGDMEPCIVVTPGMYDVDMDDIPYDVNYTDYFYEELLDLMTIVESTYSTYAEETTHEGLVASRDHRALAGLSMGSITTWHSGIVHCIDVISWFGNMSAGPSADIDEAVAFAEESVIPAIEAAAEEGYEINMMLSFNGTKDMAMDSHAETHQVLLAYMEESDLLRVGENYDFVVSMGTHSFEYWDLYLYDMMLAFFK